MTSHVPPHPSEDRDHLLEVMLREGNVKGIVSMAWSRRLWPATFMRVARRVAAKSDPETAAAMLAVAETARRTMRRRLLLIFAILIPCWVVLIWMNPGDITVYLVTGLTASVAAWFIYVEYRG